MNPDDHRRFSEALTRRLSEDERVLGLVFLGSSADGERPPDEWSDHDLWVVTRIGAATELRADLSWLPQVDRIVCSYEETVHGRGVVYEDGHLVELAVFEPDELELTRANEYRVALDRSDITSRIHSIVERTRSEASTAADAETLRRRFGRLVATLTIGINRAARGELLSANQLIRGHATTTLLELVDLVGHTTASPPDSLDVHRRFESRHPDIARRVNEALIAPPLDTAGALLELAETHLADDDTQQAAITAVRSLLERARTIDGPDAR